MTLVDLKPGDEFDFRAGQGKVLVLACGALAREIVDLIERNRWTALDLQCLPAKWHNTPEKIVPALKAKITEARERYRSIFVAYGDCGTGGALDRMLAEEGVERLDGPHCYAFFSGNAAFARHADEDVTAFFLTDYLARHFDKLVWEGLGLDRHPELLPVYFGNYTRIVFLAQTRNEELAQRAEAAARRLGLAYQYRYTGYGELETGLEKLAQG